MQNPEQNKIEHEEVPSRSKILEQTGHRLLLLFPRLPENIDDEEYLDSEQKRLKGEFGPDNVLARPVFEQAYGKVCLGLFVQTEAERRAHKPAN